MSNVEMEIWHEKKLRMAITHDTHITRQSERKTLEVNVKFRGKISLQSSDYSITHIHNDSDFPLKIVKWSFPHEGVSLQCAMIVERVKKKLKRSFF